MSSTVTLLFKDTPFRRWDIVFIDSTKNKGIVFRMVVDDTLTVYKIKQLPKFRNKIHRYLWVKTLRLRVWIGDQFPSNINKK